MLTKAERDKRYLERKLAMGGKHMSVLLPKNEYDSYKSFVAINKLRSLRDFVLYVTSGRYLKEKGFFEEYNELDLDEDISFYNKMDLLLVDGKYFLRSGNQGGYINKMLHYRDGTSRVLF